MKHWSKRYTSSFKAFGIYTRRLGFEYISKKPIMDTAVDGGEERFRADIRTLADATRHDATMLQRHNTQRYNAMTPLDGCWRGNSTIQSTSTINFIPCSQLHSDVGISPQSPEIIFYPPLKYSEEFEMVCRLPLGPFEVRPYFGEAQPPYIWETKHQPLCKNHNVPTSSFFLQ